MTESTFDQLPLAAPLQRALADKGYTSPSPIQARAIPVLLDGRDLLACAQTGTGKTAAFALPMLDAIARHPRKTFRRGVRHLVVVPTRELAVQVAESFRVYGSGLDFRSATVYGGVGAKPQISRLFQGVDVLVATPGRLLDLHGQGHIDLSQVETFVLDEADRMLDMGFIHDIRRIERELPRERQTLLFSATMAPKVTGLAASLLRNPEEIRIAPERATADKIDQRTCFVKKEDKLDLLVATLEAGRTVDGEPLSLVFSKTKHGADKLAKSLGRNGVRADAIHGNKSQAARERSLKRFRRGDIRVLVATDVAARGIDVKDITLVVNFDVPAEAESYVHRIGRTARAGASGRALSFCTADEVGLLRDVERHIRTPLQPDTDHAFHCKQTLDLHQDRRQARKPSRSGGPKPKGNRRKGPRGPRHAAKRRPNGRARSGGSTQTR